MKKLNNIRKLWKIVYNIVFVRKYVDILKDPNNPNETITHILYYDSWKRTSKATSFKTKH